MKKKILPILVVIGLIVLIVIGIAISNVIKKYTPSKEYADLYDHYEVTAEDQVVIILNYETTEYTAKMIDGHICLDYNFVHDVLNSRFYWDSNENVLCYATPTDLVMAYTGETSYSVSKSDVDFGKVVVQALGEDVYIDIDFVNLYTAFNYESFEAPNRLVLCTSDASMQTASVKKATQLRVKGGIKSDILEDLAKSDTVTIIEEGDTWSEVMSSDGVIGYVKNKTLNNYLEVAPVITPVEEVFSHNLRSYSISLGFDGIYSTAANSEVASTLASSQINVISPTWFYLDDNEGNLACLASSSYVTTCHDQGVEVWALFSNLENTEVDTTYVLTHTSTRQNLVNQMISDAIEYDIDGINLDFESIDPAVGDAYIEFVRELSIKCKNNGLVLSVDNYVPTDYTAFYDRAEQALFADYVIVMAYDEHARNSETAGSVASLDWVTTGIEDTLKEVPADQVILAMPFYTRLWSETPTNDNDDGTASYSVTCQDMTMTSANSLINQKGVEKTWMEDCGQFYATYTENGNLYEIWLEDSNSMEERLKVMTNYSLAGAAYWRLGYESSDIWDTVVKYIN